MSTVGELTHLEAGQVIVFGGNRTTTVPEELAASFVAGDRLVVVDATGDLLHVPGAAWDGAVAAIDAASGAFGELRRCSDSQITDFFGALADRLADDALMEGVREANAADVERARTAGRHTARLVLTSAMRADMVEGLRMWAAADGDRSGDVRRYDHDGWSLTARRAPLGVVGFVFEGRPNVFADAAGVVRSGNTAVLRIGSDALGTARAIVRDAVAPALESVGLPSGTVTLLDDPTRASGWALFADGRLALAVARGSGAAVTQLGAVGRQSGVAVSLHGTGGAWMVAGESADPDRFRAAVVNSLDRKVCNTLNVCAIPAHRDDLVAAFLAALDEAGERSGAEPVLHVEERAAALLPDDRVAVPLNRMALGTEWEWDAAPEVSLVAVDDVAGAVELCNTLSPRFVASLISDDAAEQQQFYDTVDAPFVGDGFTRWVDGQYALGTPELGLSNWQFGRLLARGAVLSGDSVHTVRYRATIRDEHLAR